MRGKYKKINPEEVKKIRSEYVNDPHVTIEFLTDKYESNKVTIYKLLNNKIHFDPEYVKPDRKGGGAKRSIFLPTHILDEKESVVHPTTSHRAKGQNRTINCFK